MISPIKRFGFLKKNYKIYTSEYNWLNFGFCFIVIPLLFSIYFLIHFNSLEIKNIFFNTLNFFSILIGFLITSLIFLITFNIEKNVNKNSEKIVEGTKDLIEKLSYHILTLITFSIISYVLIFFYPVNLTFVFNSITFRYLDFLFLFFVGHLLIILINILGLLGYVIKFKFAIDKKNEE